RLGALDEALALLAEPEVDDERPGAHLAKVDLEHRGRGALDRAQPSLAKELHESCGDASRTPGRPRGRLAPHVVLGIPAEALLGAALIMTLGVALQSAV